MSRSGSTGPIDWGDGTYTFRLGYAELREIQEKCREGGRECSPFAVLDRVRTGRPLVDDIREVVRIGLVGGGTPPVEALRLVRRYVDERPLAEALPIAAMILTAGLYVGDEPVGERQAAETPPPPGVPGNWPTSSEPGP